MIEKPPIAANMMAARISKNSQNAHSENIKNEISDKTNTFQPERQGILQYANAKDWLDYAKTLPTPPMLFGPVWRQGELNFLFADMGAGKTILAYQCAEQIATGKTNIDLLKTESKPQKVLYFDYELQVKQFEIRFKDEKTGEIYPLSDNIIRCELDLSELTKDELLEPLQDVVFDHMQKLVLKENIKVLIIDNLTYISDTGDYKLAIKFMQKLNTFKKQYGLSIMVIGHTPKRNLTDAINENSLSGSKKLMDLADSSFAIGKSAMGSDYRYIKQIKVRWTKFDYGADNVLSCVIFKRNALTQLIVNGTCNEQEHLKQVDIYEKRNDQIATERKNGKKLTEIAEEFGLSEKQIRNILKKQGNEPENAPF